MDKSRNKQTITRKQIADTALSWLATPFHDQACVKHVGVDCAMLIFGVAVELDMVDKKDRKKIAKYSPDWHYIESQSALVDAMTSFGCEEIPFEEAQIGDIISFKYAKTVAHVGILLENDHIIHAVKGDVGRVVINTINGDLLDRARFAYRFPGIE